MEPATTDETDVHVASAQTRTTSVLVLDDRPLVRLGIQAVLSAACADGYDFEAASGPVGFVGELVETHRPKVVAVVLRGDDPEPFRAVATAKALRDELRVLALTDDPNAADLREAVLAGVDGLLLTNAPVAELRRAFDSTSRGERTISPEIAMRLVGTWRPSERRAEPAALSGRELEVVELLAEGMTNAQIAGELSLSPRTVKTHVQNLLTKLDAPDRTGVVARAFRLGLIR